MRVIAINSSPRPDGQSCQGVIKDPDITIRTSFELWLDIMTKKVDGQQMFMDQKYTVEGDIELMIELFTSEEE